jgi:hypothetical protein
MVKRALTVLCIQFIGLLPWKKMVKRLVRTEALALVILIPLLSFPLTN